MTVFTLNGFVLFPHRANWATAPATQRRLWQTEVAEALPGAETRQALRAVARRELTFTVLARSLPEASRLEARLDAALKAGQGCAPLHGRATLLAAPANAGDTALPLAAGGAWTWQPGDYAVLIQDDLTYDVRAVLSVAGDVLTLTAGLANAWSAGALVWPLLFGALKADAQDVITGHHARVKLTLTELTSGRAAPVGAPSNWPPGIGAQVIGSTNIIG